MVTFNFHKNTKLIQEPKVIQKEKDTYKLWREIHKNFPKTERFGIGQNIEQCFLRILEFSFSGSFLKPKEKIIVLGKIITRLDVLKFFMQIAWENKLIPQKKYLIISENLNEIGKMLGGWKKGLQKKTSA